MFSQSVWDYAARPELKLILDKLKTRFGNSLNVLPSDPEWLTFEVTGLTNHCLIHLLEQEHGQMFGDTICRYQILTEQTGKERGVSIRYLPNAIALSEADSGFWYY